MLCISDANARWCQGTTQVSCVEQVLQGCTQLKTPKNMFLIFYRTQVSLGSDLWVLMSVTERLCSDLTDVTLADEDSNSIPTDDVNRVIRGNNAKWQCKWCNLVANFGTNTSSAIWWPNLHPMQEGPSGGQSYNHVSSAISGPNLQTMHIAPYGGQICNQCK